MLIVTGGAGMIGSNLVAALNKRGRRDIIVVDHLKDGRKMRNLADLDIADYIDRDEFFNEITSVNTFEKPEAVFHLGACSSTTEWDGKFMMDNNYNFSKALLSFCQETGSQFIYASSASVYGMGLNGFRENRECEKPINMYAYSKFQFDQYIRMHEKNLKAQVVGLRYFNVYGPRETHKGSMSSTPYHFNNQLLQNRRSLVVDVRRDLELAREDLFINPKGRLVEEGRVAGRHLENQNTEAPPVHGSTVS